MQLEWNDDLAIGNHLIDAEHHFFLDLVKNIVYSVEAEAHSDYIVRLLVELEKYADFHFCSEENIMLSCGYPDLARHAEIHRHLLKKLQEKIDRYKAGELEASDVLEFLGSWFLMHTAHEDKKIAEHIRKEVEGGFPDILVGGESF